MKLRIVKYHYRGKNNLIRCRFLVEELKQVWWSFLIGWKFYKWKRVQELVGGFGDCWYEDISFDSEEEAQEYCLNTITPLPKDPIIHLYTSRDELGI